MEPQMSGEPAAILILIFVILSVLISLAATVITALVYCKIFSKAGFSWALGLLMLVPIANLVMMFCLAFADWPIHGELRVLRQRCGGTLT